MRLLRSQSLVIVTGYVLGAFALYRGLLEQIPPSWTVPWVAAHSGWVPRWSHFCCRRRRL